MSRRMMPLIVFACAVQTASACSVPVFRYALEHWQPDPFMVAVFHRGELIDEQIALLEKLDARGLEGDKSANLMVKAIDLDSEPNPALLKLWELQETETVPWMAVHAPARSGPPQRIWGGEPTANVVDRLLTSPARTEIADRLIAGDSVVWVYVESGDASADDAAYELLTNQLEHLETTLRLPEIEEADFGELSIVPESLRMAFSTLRVSRDDPAESQFLTMLMHAGGASPDESSPEAMAFPIFGRGRAFDALVGDGLTEQTIEDACRFLTGACQCTVKSQNPGIDLLMAIDWDSRIEPTAIDESEPALVGLQGFAPDEEEPQPETAAEKPDEPATNTSPTPSSIRDVANDGPQSQESGNRPVIIKEFEISQIYGVDLSLSRTVLYLLGALAVIVILTTLLMRSRSG